VCGKKAVVEHLCKECFQKQHSVVERLKEFKLLFCTRCNFFSFKNKWYSADNLNDAIEKAFKKNIKFKTKKCLMTITPKIPKHKPNPGVRVETTNKIKITSQIKKINCEEIYDVPLSVKFTICQKCGKEGTQYFEGIIQLRNQDNSDFSNVRDFILNEVEKERKRGIFVTAEKEVKGGIDFYVTSQKYLQQLAQKVFKKFGGELKVNVQIFTRNRQTSKEVYRVNALIKLPAFSRNDILKIKNNLIKIKSFSGKLIVGTNLKTDKNVKIDYNADYDLVATTKDVKEVVVSKKHPSLEVLHPETYQSTRVENATKTKKDKVNVVVIEEKIYLI